MDFSGIRTISFADFQGDVKRYFDEVYFYNMRLIVTNSHRFFVGIVPLSHCGGTNQPLYETFKLVSSTDLHQRTMEVFQEVFSEKKGQTATRYRRPIACILPESIFQQFAPAQIAQGMPAVQKEPLANIFRDIGQYVCKISILGNRSCSGILFDDGIIAAPFHAINYLGSDNCEHLIRAVDIFYKGETYPADLCYPVFNDNPNQAWDIYNEDEHANLVKDWRYHDICFFIITENSIHGNKPFPSPPTLSVDNGCAENDLLPGEKIYFTAYHLERVISAIHEVGILNVYEPSKNEAQEEGISTVPVHGIPESYVPIPQQKDVKNEVMLPPEHVSRQTYASFHKGYVSAVDNEKTTSVFSIDATVLPGSSGGPVFIRRDGKLRLLGMIIAEHAVINHAFVKEKEKILGSLRMSPEENNSNNLDHHSYAANKLLVDIANTVFDNFATGIGKVIHFKHISALALQLDFAHLSCHGQHL